MEFDYFYNRDGDRFSYYMLPKLLVTDEKFKSLSSDAKILYSCLLERTSLPFRNKWLDEENRVYIIFTVEEVMETLGRPNKTAFKILNELDSTSGSGSFLVQAMEKSWPIVKEQRSRIQRKNQERKHQKEQYLWRRDRGRLLCRSRS